MNASSATLVPLALSLRQRIQVAYADLRRAGYFCRASFRCCQTCANAAIPEANESAYVYYHKQDAEEIDTRGRCYLAWAGDGKQIVEAMTGAGLKAQWDGSDDTRILVWID